MQNTQPQYSGSLECLCRHIFAGGDSRIRGLTAHVQYRASHWHWKHWSASVKRTAASGLVSWPLSWRVLRLTSMYARRMGEAPRASVLGMAVQKSRMRPPLILQSSCNTVLAIRSGLSFTADLLLISSTPSCSKYSCRQSIKSSTDNYSRKSLHLCFPTAHALCHSFFLSIDVSFCNNLSFCYSTASTWTLVTPRTTREWSEDNYLMSTYSIWAISPTVCIIGGFWWKLEIGV